jgi:hypothetical protein
MPKSAYFHGHGKKVMREMRKRHGKDAERVFYATANKRGETPRKVAVRKLLSKRH